MVLSAAAWGCTSIQWLDSAGNARTFGLATIASEDGGMITRIAAPGAALSLLPGLAGYSIGWRETTLFQALDPEAPANPHTVAFADRTYGIDVDLTQIVIGTSSTFAVIEPRGAQGIVQEIRFVEANPALTEIRRWETK